MSSYAEKGKAVLREQSRAGESSAPRQGGSETTSTSSSGSETQLEYTVGVMAMNQILADTLQMQGVSQIRVTSIPPEMPSTITQLLRGQQAVQENQDIWSGPSKAPPSSVTDIQRITELFTRVDELSLRVRNKSEPYLKNQTRKKHAQSFMRVIQTRLLEAEKKNNKARVQDLKKQFAHFQKQRSEIRQQMHEWEVGDKHLWDTVNVEVEAMKNMALDLESNLNPSILKSYLRHLRTTLDKFGNNVKILKQSKGRWEEEIEELRASLISFLPHKHDMWDGFLEAAADAEEQIFQEEARLRQAEALIASYEESEEQLQRLQAKFDQMDEPPLADMDLADLETVIRLATLEPRNRH